MRQMQRNRPFHRGQQPIVVRRRRPRRRWRFRWSLLVGVPLTCLVVAWMMSGIEVAFNWDDVMDAMNVHNRTRYTRLATIGLVLIGGVLVWRIWRGVKKDES